MKVKVTWIADNQGRRETIVDADNVPGAESQAKALYGTLPGYKSIGVNVVTKPNTNEQYVNQSSSTDGFSSALSAPSWGLREFALFPFLGLSVIMGIVGLFTFPFGIVLIISGVLLWKISTHLYMS